MLKETDNNRTVVVSSKYGQLSIETKKLNTVNNEALETAVSLLDNYSGDVKSPLGFIIKAINEGWRPDQKEEAPRIMNLERKKSYINQSNSTADCMDREQVIGGLRVIREGLVN